MVNVVAFTTVGLVPTMKVELEIVGMVNSQGGITLSMKFIYSETPLDKVPVKKT